MEPDERRDHAEALAPIVEDANGDTEVEVPVIEAKQDFVLCRCEHGKDTDAFAGTIHGGGVFERGPRGEEPERLNDGVRNDISPATQCGAEAKTASANMRALTPDGRLTAWASA